MLLVGPMSHILRVMHKFTRTHDGYEFGMCLVHRKCAKIMFEMCPTCVPILGAHFIQQVGALRHVEVQLRVELHSIFFLISQKSCLNQ